MYISIDRFEGKWAICQDDTCKVIAINRMELPSVVRPGDVVVKKCGKYFLDEAETERRKKEALFLQNKIFRKKENKF